MIINILYSFVCNFQKWNSAIIHTNIGYFLFRKSAVIPQDTASLQQPFCCFINCQWRYRIQDSPASTAQSNKGVCIENCRWNLNVYHTAKFSPRTNFMHLAKSVCKRILCVHFSAIECSVDRVPYETSVKAFRCKHAGTLCVALTRGIPTWNF